MRAKLLWLGALAVLGVVNYAIWQKEQVLAEGRTVLLELAPRDPRSLMQGDYMALNYRIAGDLRNMLSDRSLDGLAVVKVSPRGQAIFDHLYHEGEPIQPDQTLIRFRKRGPVIRIGAEAFFFQEGHAAVYASAKYGEVKLARNGDMVLVGLRDAMLVPLRAPSPAHLQ